MSLAALFEVDSIHRDTHDLCARPDAISATADFELPCKLGGKLTSSLLAFGREVKNMAPPEWAFMNMSELSGDTNNIKAYLRHHFEYLLRLKSAWHKKFVVPSIWMSVSHCSHHAFPRLMSRGV